MKTISVIYHHYPHYRSAVVRELVCNSRYEYLFYGDVDEVNGIVPFVGDDIVNIMPLKFRILGPLWLLSGYWRAFIRSDAVIVLANPNMPASWILALAGRIFKRKVVFWGHGWLKAEGVLKRLIRKVYFSLPDHVIVYGERAREIALGMGFSENKITVVYNSLDYQGMTKEYLRITDSEADSVHDPRGLFDNPELPLLICTARLTELCRFDILLEAMRMLKEDGRSVNLLLVGDGPARESLQTMVDSYQLNVNFYGACYDESILADFLYFSDVTVSPGKVGLTAIHSLTYGTPVITHGDFDCQMPEVEAIVPGKSGLFFKRNDPGDLALVIKEWFSLGKSRSEIREFCRSEIEAKWNPENQRVIIDRVMTGLLERL